ncbi:MAG TPA: PHP domain-containing protein [Candidatus Hydrogenedentes bacterium]|nr:PHP domain-containing protein [Candidatus Hydrogenedentota bacterium]HOL77911.1 PHP domain-containing protein [Candidatus Hydrogenedentota bacterium]HPO87119.1 PHP domain-containing protein [Candidatus Hydrogenedentota bacterium]
MWNRKSILPIVLVVLLVSVVFGAKVAYAQQPNGIAVHELLRGSQPNYIDIPSVDGNVVLKCDFHIHTVFSDGLVWPTFRVEEAWRDGLDAIAITDHIEEHPSKKFVGGDQNSSYEVALQEAKNRNILLIHGAEITRGQEGHYNALFLTDANALNPKDFFEAVKAAAAQGAFIFWNHPFSLRPPEQSPWCEIQEKLLAEKLLHGIEVFNGEEWYPDALQWAQKRNLTVFANTDIHGIVSEKYDLTQRHRPMTLVFAKAKTEEDLHEALRAGRTVAWFGDQLAGKQEHLTALVRACLEWEVVPEGDGSKFRVTVRNLSDIPFVIESKEAKMRGRVYLGPKDSASHVLPFKPSGDVLITNAYVGRNECLAVNLVKSSPDAAETPRSQ